ncbi:MAG: S1 RNA-binding domain-containing protein [Chloroflexi bacterium]|nr:S1 RNA-binding domain-containing protein [Chloroflexota bacterium]
MTNQTTSPEAGMEDMAALLEESDVAEPRPLRRGEVVEGTVMSLERDGILVDIGFKSEGVVTQSEMHSLGAEPFTKVSIGEKILVYVLQPETAEGQVALSIDRARGERGWRVLQDRFEAGDIFEAEITGYNKGGLLANVEGVNAFIPMSQVVGAKPGTDGTNPLSSQVGRELRLKVIEINRRRNRVILSERAALQEWRAEQKDRLLDELAEGEIRTGRITSIRNFGVFVDLGGADGLVHLSELSWDRNANPEDLFNVGDEVQVYVMKVDLETKKIALSIRRASPEEWEQLITKYQVGDVIPGVITKLVAFGAFARLPGPVEGLVHVSELVDRRIGHPDEVVQEGDIVPLKIVRIEHDRHRLGLSLREARNEALIKGWQFDPDGRVTQLPDDAVEAFPDESAAIDSRLSERVAQASVVTERREQASAGREQEQQARQAAMQDAGPVMTAMQAAMQQAQADLADREDLPADADAAGVDDEDAGVSPTAEAPTAEVSTADASTEEAPVAEAPVSEAPTEEASTAEETVEDEASEEEASEEK